MAIPTTMADLFVVRDSNSPAGSEPVFPNNDEFLRITQAILRRTNAKGTSLASSATVNIGASSDGDFIDITGAVTIIAFDVVAAGIERVARFTGVLTLTHNGTSLILPSGLNIITEVNDVAVFRSLGSGNWICTGFSRAAGYAKLSGATFTGDVVLAADPDNALEASTKQFVDAIVSTTGTATALVATRPNFKIHLAGVTGNAVTINAIALKFITGEVVRDIHLLVNDIVSVAYDGASAYWLNPSSRPIDLSSYAGTDYAPRIGESVKLSIASVASKALKVAFSDNQKYRISTDLNCATAGKFFCLAVNGGFVACGSSFNGAAAVATSSLSLGTERNTTFDGLLFTGNATNRLASITGSSYYTNGATYINNATGSSPLAYTSITSLSVGVLDAIGSAAFSATTFTASNEIIIERIS
jgi:hypothetical protein